MHWHPCSYRGEPPQKKGGGGAAVILSVVPAWLQVPAQRFARRSELVAPGRRAQPARRRGEKKKTGTTKNIEMNGSIL